jgi:hypothetical protein
MIIEERQPCPTCANRRTVNLTNWGFICFNCHRHWVRRQPGLARRRIPADEVAQLLLQEAATKTGAGHR